MPAPSKEVIKVLDGLRKEIVAGCVLNPGDKEDEAWNSSRIAGVSLIAKYKKGEGLFQQ